jgi:hypothetical protein
MRDEKSQGSPRRRELLGRGRFPWRGRRIDERGYCQFSEALNMGFQGGMEFGRSSNKVATLRAYSAGTQGLD